MKFEPDTPKDANVVSRHEPGRVWVGNAVFDTSVLVPWRGTVVDWAVARFDDLKASHFDAIAALQPEVVVFGSGERLRFAPPALMARLMAERIGVETMDTGAACRTYNVLASEGRRVLAALLIEPTPHSEAGG
ncbi:MAG: Mth938-like domain-containing protein [Pseudomonadota bacterium]|nr:Mth938-like domain-containing protein [Pseudomonadota bacterium]